MSKAETGKFNRREAINLSIFSSMRLIGIGVGVGVVGAANPGAAVAATGNPWETSPIQTSPVLEKIRKLEQTEKDLLMYQSELADPNDKTTNQSVERLIP